MGSGAPLEESPLVLPGSCLWSNARTSLGPATWCGVQGAGGAGLQRTGSAGTEEAVRNPRVLPPFVEGKLRLVGAGVASCPSAIAAGGGLGPGVGCSVLRS